MRKIISILLSVSFFLSLSNTQASVTKGKNSTTSRIPKEAVQNVALLNDDNSLRTIDYSDGLGRGTIRVVKKASEGNDLVSVVSYDQHGMINEQWLPTPIESDEGLPDLSAIQTQAKSYYGDTIPYQINLHLPFLGISMELVVPAGKNWHNNNKTRESRVSLNEEPEEEFVEGDWWDWDWEDWEEWNKEKEEELAQVKAKKAIFMYMLKDGGVMRSGEDYPYFSIHCVFNEDEDGRLSLQFYNFEKQVLLDRRVLSESDNDFLDTYYVYDDKGRLRFVLPPEATSRMREREVVYTHEGINTSNNPIDQYAYIYEYDRYDRCVAQKGPGTDWVYIVYDAADRQVLSQDGNQRDSSLWSFMKYDRYGRLIQSGTQKITDSLPAIREYCAARHAVESWDNTAYTNLFSLSTGTERRVLKEMYYDNYSFLSAYPSLQNVLVYSELSGFDSRFQRFSDGVDISTRGRLTGLMTALLDGSCEMVSALYYDARGNVVQRLGSNHMNGYDKYYYAYDFQGNTLRQRHLHKTGSNAEIAENYTFEYDDRLRPVATYYALNNHPATKINSTQYNEIGQVSGKKLHNDKYSIAYEYNIHGQPKQINSKFFSQTIYYEDYNGGNGYYNGNVSAVVDKVNEEISGGRYMSVEYEYDDVNRLISTTSFEGGSSEYSFSTSYLYDKNSNIRQLFRDGVGYGCSQTNYCTQPVDYLEFSLNGNQLHTVNETHSGYPIFSVDFTDRRLSDGGAEYLYDKNGNQTADYNKKIAWIRYNLLNLQEKVQLSNGNKIDYRYDASGVKRQAVYSYTLNTMQIPLGETTTENTAIRSVSTRDYCANFVYLNGQVQRVLIPGGYISTKNTTNTSVWEYVYHLNDYLGNVRAEIKSSGGLDNTTGGLSKQSYAAYYPYGQEKMFEFYCSFGGGEESPVYEFGENELEPVTMYHDFNFRWYDQQLGRFLNPDPLAALDYSVSPYTYCRGNPANFVDPWGLTAEDPKEGRTLPEVVITPDKQPYNYPYYFGGGYPWPSDPEEFSYQEWLADMEETEEAELARRDREAYSRMKEQGIEWGEMFGLIDDWTNGVGVGVEGMSLSVNSTLERALAYHNSNSLLKPNEVMFKLPKTNVYLPTKLVSGFSKAAGTLGSAATGLSVGMTIYDSRINGWKNHHTADLLITGGMYGVALAFPVVGWAAGGLYFAGDLTCRYYTGKSITENLFD